MGHFTKDFITFFKDLANNNSKNWFDQNRKRYEISVKKPFNAFVEEMIVRIHADNPDVLITPSEAIFRINRDIRFSNDKTPYKTHMSAFISPGGKKAKDEPGFYFQLGVNGIRIYSGVYQLDKEKLNKVRSAIAINSDNFSEIINNDKFRSKYGEVLGERHKRIPPEFRDAAIKQPLIANKSFYVMADIEEMQIIAPKLSGLLMDYYFAVKAFLEFLTSSL
jgi:uncharacterized protein (TIGR02453 family)